MADSHHDCIYLRNLHLSAIVGKDAWQRPSKPQPLIISIKLFRDIADAGETDDISKTSNYGQICKDVQAFMQEGFPNLRHLSRQLVFLAASKKWGARDLHITLTLPKGLLRAEKGIQHELITGCQPRIFIEDSTTPLAQETWSINDIKLACIIGVNAHERLKKQIVVVSLKFTADRSTMRHEDQDTWATAQWEGLVDRVIRNVEESSYETLEALAAEVVEIVYVEYDLERVTVSVEKPNALAFVDGAGVQITRSKDSFEKDTS